MLMALAIGSCDLSARTGPTSFDTGAAAGEPAVYRLAPGDEIDIRIEGEPDLSTQAVVDAAGQVGVPLLGYMDVTGLTLAEASSAIKAAYGDGYLKNPSVLVTLKTARPYFITGQVVNPGAYRYQPGLSVAEALIMAGGMADGIAAGNTRIMLTREGTVRRLSEALAARTQLRPDDLVSVEPGRP